jgi:hypothetical protein
MVKTHEDMMTADPIFCCGSQFGARSIGGPHSQAGCHL